MTAAAERWAWRDAAMVSALGWFAGCILFAVVMTALTAGDMQPQRRLAETAMSLIAFAMVPGTMTAVLVLPCMFALILMLRRFDVGKAWAAPACLALGAAGTYAFTLLFAEGGLIGLVIPAPAAQGVATALIYLRVSDG